MVVRHVGAAAATAAALNSLYMQPSLWVGKLACIACLHCLTLLCCSVAAYAHSAAVLLLLQLRRVVTWQSMQRWMCRWRRSWQRACAA